MNVLEWVVAVMAFLVMAVAAMWPLWLSIAALMYIFG